MMNKGLEVIEAHHLFGVDVDHVDVVVHPQSVIHSMIRMRDGSVLAQMGKPSMILPIMVALYYPERGPRLLEEFDPFSVGCNDLTFEKCDTEVFRLLKTAYDCGREGGLMPTVMNAANEIAVFSFLAGKSGYLDIERTVMTVCDKMHGKISSTKEMTVDDILATDKEARVIAGEILKR
jgi:1-deoxy-D-xylulose-5-phosphate reductoisomerase